MRRERLLGVFALLCACHSLPTSTAEDAARFREDMQADVRESARDVEPERPHPTLHGFRVADLPRASIPPPAGAYRAARARESARTVVDDLARDARVRGGKPPFWGDLKEAPNGALVGDFAAWTPPRAFGWHEETFIACRNPGVVGGKKLPPPPSEPVPARFLSLVDNDAGSAILSIVDAWITGPDCGGWVERITTSVAQRIHPSSAMFAYVDTSFAPSPDLVVLLPEGTAHASANGGAARVVMSAITEVRLPLNRNVSGELVAEASPASLATWFAQLRGAKPKEPLDLADQAYALLGVELTPSDGDLPMAVAWTALVPNRYLKSNARPPIGLDEDISDDFVIEAR